MNTVTGNSQTVNGSLASLRPEAAHTPEPFPLSTRSTGMVRFPSLSPAQTRVRTRRSPSRSTSPRGNCGRYDRDAHCWRFGNPVERNQCGGPIWGRCQWFHRDVDREPGQSRHHHDRRFFRWDTSPGFYEVEASASGCVSPSDPGISTVTSAPFFPYRLPSPRCSWCSLAHRPRQHSLPRPTSPFHGREPVRHPVERHGFAEPHHLVGTRSDPSGRRDAHGQRKWHRCIVRHLFGSAGDVYVWTRSHQRCRGGHTDAHHHH